MFRLCMIVKYISKGYDVFIKASEPFTKKVDRLYTSQDLFPTTLARLGVKWKEHRLESGTNLFSTEKTLIEILVFDDFQDQLKRTLKFYNNNIQYIKD